MESSYFADDSSEEGWMGDPSWTDDVLQTKKKTRPGVSAEEYGCAQSANDWAFLFEQANHELFLIEPGVPNPAGGTQQDDRGRGGRYIITGKAGTQQPMWTDIILAVDALILLVLWIYFKFYVLPRIKM